MTQNKLGRFEELCAFWVEAGPLGKLETIGARVTLV